ncbi:hypothetical protein PIB30_049566 [Stylosanthes scabra]|uniref:F-box domain-containing protein n=1 Tax=Stylosanthes scabra TaxID=79078 RepID=A0ABU6RHE7_9FABA|nr:hypothetical protein [Stylosanthes scabra]
MTPELPDECLESILKHISHPHDHESLSLVSKHFLSFINRIHTHLSVSDGLLPHLPALLRRFTNLTSIKVTYYFTGDIDALLSQIASFDLPSLHSLDISYRRTFPSHGLRQFSQKFPTLKSLNCSRTRPDLVLIAECFPNLEEIDVSFVPEFPNADLHVKALTSGLKKLRQVNLSGSYFFDGSSIFTLCQNCVSLEALAVDEGDDSKIAIANSIRERPQLRSLKVISQSVTLEPIVDTLVSLKFLTCLDLFQACISDEALCAIAEGGPPLRELNLYSCQGYGLGGISCLLRKCNNLQCLDLRRTDFLNDQCVMDLSLLLGNLKVVNLSQNANLTDLSLYAIMRNCPLITEIRMDCTGVGKQKVEEDCLVVNSHLKFLYLAANSGLDDESVTMLASVCPNLEIIDLTSSCRRISKGAIDILCRCCKIQRMDIDRIGCDLPQFQFRVNFEVPTLSVLNLSLCSISDEELSLLSKSCYNLKELTLDFCDKITANGVKQVVKNCKQLRMISLLCCNKVTCDVVAWMVLARPSLRKILPPAFNSSDINSQRDFFLRHGCFVVRREDFYYERWGESDDFLDLDW